MIGWEIRKLASGHLRLPKRTAIEPYSAWYSIEKGLQDNHAHQSVIFPFRRENPREGFPDWKGNEGTEMNPFLRES